MGTMENKTRDPTQVFIPGTKDNQARTGEMYTVVDPQQTDLQPEECRDFTKGTAPCCGGKCGGTPAQLQILVRVAQNPERPAGASDASDPPKPKMMNVRDFLDIGEVYEA